MVKPRVLVTAAAGRTGLPTALQLLARGYPVRAMVRRLDARAERLRAAGAELAVGSLTDLADVERALRGVRRAYFCPPWGPDLLHVSETFALAGEEAGLESIVALSQWLASARHPSVETRALWLMERTLPRTSRAAVTIVNPGFFADNYMRLMEPVAQLGILPMSLGDGRNAPPSNEDIARVAAGALADPGRHGGKTYRPTGPALLSPVQIAEAFARVLGRRVRYLELPERMLRKALRVVGLSPFEQSQVPYYFEDYRRGAFAVNAPSDAVRQVGGVEPESFEATVRRYAAELPEARRSVAGQVRAMWTFTRILLTPPLDAARFERLQGHPPVAGSEYAMDSGAWLASHLPARAAAVTR